MEPSPTTADSYRNAKRVRWYCIPRSSSSAQSFSSCKGVKYRSHTILLPSTHSDNLRQLKVKVLLSERLAVEDGLAERLTGTGHARTHVVLVLCHLRRVLALEQALVERLAEAALLGRRQGLRPHAGVPVAFTLLGHEDALELLGSSVEASLGLEREETSATSRTAQSSIRHSCSPCPSRPRSPGGCLGSARRCPCASCAASLPRAPGC